MRVLLFGGAGYIGTHVAIAFMDRGDHVGIYDNLSTGLRSNVPEGASFYEGDILDREHVAMWQRSFPKDGMQRSILPHSRQPGSRW